MNPNQLSSLSKLRGSTVLNNGQKAISVNDLVKFAKQNDIGISKQDAVEMAEQFKVQPGPDISSIEASKMIDVDILEQAMLM